MTEQWMQEFNEILGRRGDGVRLFSQLPDEDQEEITSLANQGFTAWEAFDVLSEVGEVE